MATTRTPLVKGTYAAGTHTVKEYVHLVRPQVTTGTNVTFTLFGK